jgi:hypothetical protein
MTFDVEEVYTSEDFLGRVFDERSIFPIISMGGERGSRFRAKEEGEKVVGACFTNRRRT